MNEQKIVIPVAAASLIILSNFLGIHEWEILPETYRNSISPLHEKSTHSDFGVRYHVIDLHLVVLQPMLPFTTSRTKSKIHMEFCHRITLMCEIIAENFSNRKSLEIN